MATAVGGHLPPVRAVPPRVDWRRKYAVLATTLTSSITYMAGLSLPGRLLSGMLSGQRNGDGNRALRRSQKHLVLLATLSATVTFQAGVSPPSRFSRGEATGAHYRSDDFLHERFLVFFCCNASAFDSSLAIVLIILLRDVFGAQGIKHYRALLIAVILDLFTLIGAYIAGASLHLFTQIVVLWVLCASFLLAVFLAGARWRQAFREKMGLCVPRRLKMLFDDPEEDEDDEDDEDDDEGEVGMSLNLENRRQLLLLLAILAAILAYHARPNFRPDDRFNYYGCLVFSYCKATVFLASLSIIAMLVNRKLPSARGLRWHALRLSVILDVIGLTGAFTGVIATGGYSKISEIDVLFLPLAVLLCIAFQITLSISGTARGLVQTLAPSLGAAEEEDGSEDELELGIGGGTKEEPLGVEISSPILGGALILILAVPVMDILANPVRLLLAIMVASIGVSLWRRLVAPLLRALSRALQRRCTVNLQGTTPAPPPTGSVSSANSTTREQLVSALCHGLCKVIHTLCLGTWMWIPILVIWVPSLRQNLKVRFKISKITAVLGVLVLSAPTTATPTADAVTATGMSTTTTTTTDTPSTATSSTVTGTPATAARTTSRSRGRGDVPLVEARPRRNRRPNNRLIGQDWVN